VDAVETAQRLADEVLFPAALETDRADVRPIELLDEIAAAGLYGLASPVVVGGLDADFETVCGVWEALSSGCLTTAFVWGQHIGLVRSLAESDSPELKAAWLGPLTKGTIRAGLALGGALPQPTLHASRVDGGWRLDGFSPFVSGWDRVDVVHTATRTENDDEVVWLIVDATEGPALAVERLRLVALNATATVRADFSGLIVPDDRVTAIHPFGGATPPEVLRIHASLALGVTARCCRLLGPSRLDEELADCKRRLDALDEETIATDRASAGALAVRAATALVAANGSRSLILTDHAQRLAREALFTAVYALRPASRDALLAMLGAA
jgi:alkylation response protein AidB-like acyl-CoA dehydrogenase